MLVVQQNAVWLVAEFKQRLAQDAAHKEAPDNLGRLFVTLSAVDDCRAFFYKDLAMHVVCIVQARMGASRFPGKPLKTVLHRPLLSYLVERLRQASTLNEIVIATSIDPRDDAIAKWCAEEKIACFRGSEQNVLERYVFAARAHHADVVVRVTGDCPLIDPEIVDTVVRFYLQHQFDYVSNAIVRSYPRGLDVEICSLKVLEKALQLATKPEEREHVTLYLYEHPEQFSIGSVKQSSTESNDRWTVDTPEDFELVSKLLTALYPQNPQFRMKDVLILLDKHPEWRFINAHIQQKAVR